MSRGGFTLIELLVVAAIISLLIAIVLPTYKNARAQSWEVRCRSNLHQIHVALEVYANEHNELYPVSPTEMNPHVELVGALQAEDTRLMDAMYCPRVDQMEPVAQDTVSYPPIGEKTSIIDTPENRKAGNIGYLYWSFKDPLRIAASGGARTTRSTTSRWIRSGLASCGRAAIRFRCSPAIWKLPVRCRRIGRAITG